MIARSVERFFRQAAPDIDTTQEDIRRASAVTLAPSGPRAQP